MIELQGLKTNAILYTDTADGKVQGQILELISNPICEDTTVRSMPDLHFGKGSPIGTTIKLNSKRENWKISPNIVGVDIGCGMMSFKIKEADLSKNGLKKLDESVANQVPSGFSVHERGKNNKLVRSLINDLSFKLDDKLSSRAENSLGTLGGGNHFIELAKGHDGDVWLTVHSGSRNLGLTVCDYHQKMAINEEVWKNDFNQKIIELKNRGLSKEIESFKKSYIAEKPTNKALSYLSGDLLEAYLNDMEIAQKYARINRETMLNLIVDAMGWSIEDSFDSIHNFIDIENGILRKGATSANLGERLIIPLNMRDGSLICVGKGNKEWNYSAPHGAGRLMGRAEAKEKLKLTEYQKQMKDVYTSSVGNSTLDEAPNAYKPMDEIIDNIGDTVEIVDQIKPLYNFKAH